MLIIVKSLDKIEKNMGTKNCEKIIKIIQDLFYLMVKEWTFFSSNNFNIYEYCR